MEEKVRMTLVLPEELHVAFSYRARKGDVGTKAALIRRLLRAYVEGRVTDEMLFIKVDPTIIEGEKSKEKYAEGWSKEKDDQLKADVAEQMMPDLTQEQYKDMVNDMWTFNMKFDRPLTGESDIEYFASKYNCNKASVLRHLMMYPPNDKEKLSSVAREYLGVA